MVVEGDTPAQENTQVGEVSLVERDFSPHPIWPSKYRVRVLARACRREGPAAHGTGAAAPVGADDSC